MSLARDIEWIGVHISEVKSGTMVQALYNNRKWNKTKGLYVVITENTLRGSRLRSTCTIIFWRYQLEYTMVFYSGMNGTFPLLSDMIHWADKTYRNFICINWRWQICTVYAQKPWYYSCCRTNRACFARRLSDRVAGVACANTRATYWLARVACGMYVQFRHSTTSGVYDGEEKTRHIKEEAKNAGGMIRWTARCRNRA